MENIQQTTQAVTFNLPKASSGGNREKVEKAPVGFQHVDKPPVDSTDKNPVGIIVNEVEQKEDREKREVEVVEADRIISVLNNKLQIVSDDRSRTGLVVKILDKESGDLIKQIPSDEVLNIIARFKDSVVGGIIDDNA
ncbi:MAG: flagellar protein FlaG [Candidatus Anammoxibacter sp.]